ncbi:MAG TPA: L,D-transpeptidase [Candidatus Acidoferrales bacterium]|nr:L,D-transpeptidase [Candidatus Acidoferrales bacterium]
MRAAIRIAAGVAGVALLCGALNTSDYYLRAAQLENHLARARAQGVPASMLARADASLAALRSWPRALTSMAVIADPFRGPEELANQARAQAIVAARAHAEDDLTTLQQKVGPSWDENDLRTALARAQTPTDYRRLSAAIDLQRRQAAATMAALGLASGGLQNGLPLDVVTHLKELQTLAGSLGQAGLDDGAVLQAASDARWYLTLTYPTMLGLHPTLTKEVDAAQTSGQQTLGAYNQARSLLSQLPALLARADGLGLGSSFDASAQSLRAQSASGPGAVSSEGALAQLVQQLRAAASGSLPVAGVGCIAGAAPKLIVVHVLTQQLIAYNNGCPWLRSLITTGRPQLPTDEGNFHIFYKAPAYRMVSPWPPASGLWYPPTWVYDAMEFVGDGTFLHTADWEPQSAFGPGSEYGGYASHGCVHLQDQIAAQLYAWADLGTSVDVTA